MQIGHPNIVELKHYYFQHVRVGDSKASRAGSLSERSHSMSVRSCSVAPHPPHPSHLTGLHPRRALPQPRSRAHALEPPRARLHGVIEAGDTARPAAATAPDARREALRVPAVPRPRLHPRRRRDAPRHQAAEHPRRPAAPRPQALRLRLGQAARLGRGVRAVHLLAILPRAGARPRRCALLDGHRHVVGGLRPRGARPREAHVSRGNKCVRAMGRVSFVR